MLAKRVIPVMLVRGNQLVKGRQFKSWRSVGIAEQAERIYARRGVDELVILDIGATPAGTGPDLELVRRLTDGNFCPIAVGGGVRTVEDVRALLNAGADKVVIGTQAIESWGLIKSLASKFGSQAICVSLDYTEKWVKTHCGTKLQGSFGCDVVKYAKLMRDCGAGEILLNSIDRDGMMAGYDLATIKLVSAAADIPVIASGGCGTYEHMHEAILAGADAVASGAMFQFGDETPKEAAEYLIGKGIVCRT